MDNMELSYQGIKDAIKKELNQIAWSFVEIGYQLKQVRDKELYKEDGYNNIHEFAFKEYNLSQTYTSRFISINDCFSINGNSPRLLEQYEGYGSSKLSEMLTLSEEELKLVSIRTTRAEIREIKQTKNDENSEKLDIYAHAHNMVESTDFTHSEVNSEALKTYIIPEADKLIIEFFREKSRRITLKELAAVLHTNSRTNDDIAKAIELINPSGHLMHRKGIVIMMFEEDHIKYNKMGTPTVEYSYRDFIHDLVIVFDMYEADPWVVFYGEPEPEPEPPKKEPVPEKKIIQDKPAAKPISKKTEKPKISQRDDEEEDEEEPEESDDEIQEEIPGQMSIEKYPEFLPEDSTEEQEEPEKMNKEKIEDVITEKIPEEQEDAEEQVEIVEADIVETQRDGLHCAACSDIESLMIANAVIISVNSKGRVLLAKWEYLGRVREKSIEINFCPVCGRKL